MDPRNPRRSPADEMLFADVIWRLLGGWLARTALLAASAAAVRSGAEDERRGCAHSGAAVLNDTNGGPEGVSAARIIRPGIHVNQGIPSRPMQNG
jgi:hypothetical protein